MATAAPSDAGRYRHPFTEGGPAHVEQGLADLHDPLTGLSARALSCQYLPLNITYLGMPNP